MHLLRRGTESQFAVLRVKVHRAEGLPNLTRGLLSHFKKRYAVEEGDFIDPCVHVFFAGLKGCTTRKKQTTCPVWNEQIVFTTKFPLPSGPIVVQVRDDDFMVNNDIGTVAIPLEKISSSNDHGVISLMCQWAVSAILDRAVVYILLKSSHGLKRLKSQAYLIAAENCFLPTFGPCYVYLRNQKSLDDASYNGRLLMAVETEIIEESGFSRASVLVEPTSPVLEETIGYDAECFLFGCVHDASIIDRTLAEMKDIRFSLQMGPKGREAVEGEFDDNNATPFVSPLPMDKRYVYAPYEDTKPCMWLKGIWPDDRKRMFVSNILWKMGHKLKECLTRIQKPSSTVHPEDESSNNNNLLDLQNIATCYLKVLREYCDMYLSKTKLDHERAGIFLSDMEDIVRVCDIARKASSRIMLEGALAKLKYLRSKMKFLTEDPQCAMPEIIAWMESGPRRIGFARVSARDLLYAVREYERGICSGRVISLFFKPLGKHPDGAILAKVECYLWLGLEKQKACCFRDLPQGFNAEYAFQVPGDADKIPRALNYFEKNVFQLRAHIYQARSLPCKDSTRYPSCYARVFIKNQALSTQIQESTINPIWDEMLLFSSLEFHGDPQWLHDSPPSVFVEILNFTAVGRAGFLGRTIVPVNVYEKSNRVTALRWFDISGASSEKPQLLAAFELFPQEEVHGKDGGGDADVISVSPIPEEIRPRFVMHRIEILLWGLRELRRSQWKNVDRPRIDVECAGQVLHSSVISNYRHYSNFGHTHEHMDLELPEQEEYFPTLTLKLIDTKSFGRKNIIATHTITRLHDYVFRQRPTKPASNLGRRSSLRMPIVVLNIEDSDFEDLPGTFLVQPVDYPWSQEEKKKEGVGEEEEAEQLDWWSRYFLSTGEKPEEEEILYSIGPNTVVIPRASLPQASLAAELKTFRDMQNTQRNSSSVDKDFMGFMVYSTELENVPEFGGFQEWLHSYELTRGKKIKKVAWNPSREKVMAILKGCFRIYKIPLPQPASDPLLPINEGQEGLFGGLPKNKPMKVLVRAYMVKATNLEPSDATNTTDAYVVLQLGKQRLSDKENYVSKQLNPVFGKCFEFVANFPSDSILHVQLFDWNLVGPDELIGETVIDLENRFYSRHRATCGLARVYQKWV
ncbi:otoferlin [Caerostris darwini]|uniref:Otoferlin n=1 Tax=Caerostris darwini TaxID=1538125 RepID=A0AAV4X8G1_9ARAC|nr:otoferlin [Caerostris darwini]